MFQLGLFGYRQTYSNILKIFISFCLFSITKISYNEFLLYDDVTEFACIFTFTALASVVYTLHIKKNTKGFTENQQMNYYGRLFV